LPELNVLDLAENTLAAAGALALAHSAITGTLVELVLDKNALQDQGAAALGVASWPLLQRLSVQGNEITDQGARLLARSKTLEHVPVIACQGNRIRYETYRELGTRLRQW
jgi:Ran GTPase-activating protein (RanGAP) involved in mRNA processing and transport